jgi:hypothetical protein
MQEQQKPQDEQYAEYDPVEGLRSPWALPIAFTNTEIAASGAKINTHVPTPDEIATRKYVLRRYRHVGSAGCSAQANIHRSDGLLSSAPIVTTTRCSAFYGDIRFRQARNKQ